MGRDPRHTFRALRGPLAGGLLALAALVAVVPPVLERVLAPAPVVEPAAPPPAPRSVENVGAFVDRALAERTILGRTTGRDGEPVLTVEVAPSKLAIDDAEALRHLAEAAGIETYAVDLDGLDAETKLYQQVLVERVRFVPTVPALVSVPRELRPALVALVVTGVGDGVLPKALRKTPIPFTLAIDAFRPGSLEAAEQGIQASHEVLVALGGDAATDEQWRAIPYASGFLLTGDAPLPPLHDAFQVVVASHPRATKARAVVAQWGSPERDTMLALRRALWLASRTGSAALVLRADDPHLSEVVATLANTEDIRPVLASEAARPAEVRGPPHEESAVSAPTGG